MPRLGEIDRARLTERQRQVADEIQSGPRGGLAGPFWPWLRSPDLAERAQKLGELVRFHSTLSPRLFELAVLVTAHHWKAPKKSVSPYWRLRCPLSLCFYRWGLWAALSVGSSISSALP